MTDIRYRFVDLFAGCGGLSEGFRQAKWEPIFAVEKNAAAAASYSANFGCPVWADSIEDFVPRLKSRALVLPNVHAVIGGPPCQGFSPLGKMSATVGRTGSHAHLNNLWRYFVETVEILRPKVFVMENVPQFLCSDEFREFRESAEGLGYTLDCGVLRAEQYGVPQKRRRAFCLGSVAGIPRLPAANGLRQNVRQAIGHLSIEPDGRNWHVGRNPTTLSLRRYALIPPGGNRFDLVRSNPDLAPPCWRKKVTGTTDVFGRLVWTEPASTIRTEFFKPEKGRYLHPEANRPITHREAALLQTFPETFVFEGTRIEVARQIGEAVPPLLARTLGEAAMAIVDSH